LDEEEEEEEDVDVDVGPSDELERSSSSPDGSVPPEMGDYEVRDLSVGGGGGRGRGGEFSFSVCCSSLFDERTMSSSLFLAQQVVSSVLG